ncbi:MAG TPA: hypothetical protein PLY34_08860 [Ferruginibacter sp.]|nr:hypothetical protein [Ferruginibacter sp.]HPH90201.1 hypothetical protein [Ferruginibacter sp.]
MKKIFTHAIKRLLPLLLFLIAQIRVWAIDTTTATTIERSNNIFAQPWIWIGITVVVAIKLLGPFTADTDKFVIVRKKTRKPVTKL